MGIKSRLNWGMGATICTTCGNLYKTNECKDCPKEKEPTDDDTK